jgi:hypothetical protein
MVIREMSKMPCEKHLSISEKQKKKKEIQASALKLPNISSFLSAKDKNISDDNLVSGKSASKSVTVDTGIRETETEPISDRINVDVDTGIRFELEPSSSKVVNVSTSLNIDLDISWENIKSSSYQTNRGHFKGITVDEQIKRFIVENGHCRPKSPFKKDMDGRSFSEEYYYTVSKSGLKIEKSWLCYSPLLQKAYCEPFANRRSGAFREIWVDSVGDWKHIAGAIEIHGTSRIHFNSCLIYSQ